MDFQLASFFVPHSLSGDNTGSRKSPPQASGGFSSIHFHLRVQLCAAYCVQVHYLTRGLHSQPPNRLDPASVLDSWDGMGALGEGRKGQTERGSLVPQIRQRSLGQ